MHLLQSLLCLASLTRQNFFGYFSNAEWNTLSSLLWIIMCNSSKHKTFEFGGWWMSLNVFSKVSVFSNLSIVFSEMVLCFIFQTSQNLHANKFRDFSEVYANLIRHASFHFLTTGNFTQCIVLVCSSIFFVDKQNLDMTTIILSANVRLHTSLRF